MFKPLKAAVSAGLALLVAASTYSNAGAQAYSTKFITSITYQNVGSDAAKVELNFYNENIGTPIAQPLPDLPKDAGTAFYVGNATNLSAGFKGAAVLSSGQPIIATMVQVPQSTTVRNRPLSNGFDGSAGAANVRIATVLKNTFDQTTQFSVQNVDSVANNLEVKFINADPAAGAIGATLATVPVTGLPVNSVKYFDASTVSGLPSSFSGSATISAKRADGSDGKVVATALELNITGAGASAFEGLASDGAKFYMPSAICNAFGGQNTAYAVQNTSTTADANITVTYSYRPANDANAAIATVTDSKTVAAGAKASFVGCNKMPQNSNGSAVITSTGANIVAIGKVFGAGLSTAAPGAAAGAAKLALPYVRFTADATFNNASRQRAFIAIQNVGADLAAGSVTVKYIGRDGTVLGTHTLPAIPANSKVASNPTLAGTSAALQEFGYYADGFGGSAVIEGPAGSQLVVVARVQSVGVGEDYNGIPVQ